MLKKRMRRFLAGIAASIMVVGLAACGGKTVEVVSEYWEYESGESVSSKNGANESGGESETSHPGAGNSGNSSVSTASRAQSTPDKLDPSGGTDLKGMKIRIASWDKGVGPNPSSLTYKQETELVSSIEKKYGCKLEWVTEPDSLVHSGKFVTAAMSGRTLAEIVYLAGDSAWPSNVLKGYFQPLDSIIDLKLPQWNKSTTDYLAIKGKHYFLVTSAITGMGAGTGVYFNKSLFKKFNQKTPYEYISTNTWNWNNFLAVAKAMTQKEGSTNYYGLASLKPVSFIYSNGISPIKMVNGKATFNLDNPQTIAAIQFAYDLYNTHKVIPLEESDENWKNGIVAMTIDPYWKGQGYLQALGDSNVGFAHLPKGPAVKDYYYVNEATQVVGIPSTVKNNADTIAKILTDFTGLYRWRQTGRQLLEQYMGDETALTLALEQVERKSRTTEWV